MSFLHHHITFKKVDPLGDGVAEEIAAEQSSPDAIRLEETSDGEQLVEQWDKVVQDIEKDPEWFKFADGE